MIRDRDLPFGNLDNDPVTHACSYCRGTGYRLVSRHIEVECVRCKGKGYVVTGRRSKHRGKPNVPQS
jgi:DnaJ-class molecular chaperone